jgi:hypothetical protein
MEITIRGITFNVEFEYFPGQKGYRNSMGVPEEPDDPEELVINSVHYKLHDVTDRLDDDWFAEIEEALWDGRKS